MDTKRCSRCGEQLPLDMFYRNSARKAGYTSSCKKCSAERKGHSYTPKEEWPEGFRACTKCEQIKPLEEFHKMPRGRFGRASVCIACRSRAKPKPQAKEGYQFCYKCGKEKPATPEYFRRASKTKTGLVALCRVCARQEAKDWREKKVDEDPDYIKRLYWKDPEKQRQMGRNSYIRNKANRRAYNVRKYHEDIEESRRKNREEYQKRQQQMIEKSRQWRQENPERYRAYNRQWAEANPETHKASIQTRDQRRRARKRNLPNNFTLGDWLYCLEYWEHQCAVCRDTTELHADHWIALSKEGTSGTVPENMVVLCSHCNQTKHVIDPKSWLIRKLGEEMGLAKLAEIEAYFQHLRDRKSNGEL